jgi:hypothetical protein
VQKIVSLFPSIGSYDWVRILARWIAEMNDGGLAPFVVPQTFATGSAIPSAFK